MTLAAFGSGFLLGALVLVAFSAAVSFWAGRREAVRLALVGRRAFYAAALGVVAASAALETALLTHDFAIAFVAEHIDSGTPLSLVASAFYSGQEGSLLYWTLILSLLGSVALAAAQGVRLTAYATGFLGVSLGFFLLVLVFVASPFATLRPVPTDGLGLNPLLRDQGMLIHPPFLLAGFSSFTLPFSFAAAALLARRLDVAWFAQIRRLALLAWGLQTVGLTLGMWWAYHVLGWGGYWGWDPVENVGLLPWLVTTAFIHSAQLQERRGVLKAWNIGLVMLAFCLSIFGTFVVRSGVIESVHSFAISSLGPWFLGFLTVAAATCAILLARARGALVAAQRIEATVSREGAFLLNNFVLLALVSAIFWGTMLPLVSGLFTGRQAVVGPGFYERVAGPLFLLLLALLAVGPLLPWQGGGRRLAAFRWPALAGAGTAVGLWAGGIRDWLPLVTAAVLAAAATTSVIELLRRPAASVGWAQAALRNRRRYGAYMTHLGVIVVAIGIAGSHFGQVHHQVVLRPGEHATVAGYRLDYTGSSERRLSDSVQQTTQLRLGDEVLEPQRTVYPTFGGQTASGIVIRSTPLRDLYIVLTGSSTGGGATFDVFVNPLVTWIWAGAALIVMGVLAGNLRGLPVSRVVRAPARAPALAGTSR